MKKPLNEDSGAPQSNRETQLPDHDVYGRRRSVDPSMSPARDHCAKKIDRVIVRPAIDDWRLRDLDDDRRGSRRRNIDDQLAARNLGDDRLRTCLAVVCTVFRLVSLAAGMSPIAIAAASGKTERFYAPIGAVARERWSDKEGSGCERKQPAAEKADFAARNQAAQAKHKSPLLVIETLPVILVSAGLDVNSEY